MPTFNNALEKIVEEVYAFQEADKLVEERIAYGIEKFLEEDFFPSGK